MTQTPIDLAHAAMEAAPDDDAARLRFYERLADAELYLLLEREPEGDNISPEVFDLGDMQFVLVFDTEERLSQFVGRAAPYVALSGRALAGMLAGQGVGLSLNPDVAPSAFVMPAEAVAWLAQTLGQAPSEAEARPSEVFAPSDVPETLVRALDAKLSIAQGLARKAYLVGVLYDDGTRSHMIGLTGTVPGAEGALAKAVNEALIFSGIEAGALDVVFLSDSDAITAQLAKVGLRFDLPDLPKPEATAPKAPGRDPDAPPKLR